MQDPKGYYETLQVSQRASPEIIEAAHKILLVKHQPRLATDDGKVAREIGAAYEVLRDPKARYSYDKATPKSIGNYELIEQLGEGGFGRTYKARHSITQGMVCIKDCFKVAPEYDAILVNEALAMWDLRHYAIPAVRDVLRTSSGSLALAMSYIPGIDMEKYIGRNGPLDPEYAASVCDRVLNALRYIHYHSVIHGDMKPGNIILQEEERMAVICDFGLSAIKPGVSHKSLGYTPLFSSPEEIAGRPLLPESDLFSWAMTLIFALNGSIEATRRMEVPDTVPDAFCTFLKRFLKKNPTERPSWHNTNIYEDFVEMRLKAFGRRHSRE